jgi:hypothetical protein
LRFLSRPPTLSPQSREMREGVKDEELGEQARVVYHRYKEAREYGLTRLEARLYAESTIDASELRRLRRAGCAPAIAAKILL